MPEPVPTQPQPEAQPKQNIVIGETTIYLKSPTIIDGQETSSFVVQATKDRGPSGINSSVLLSKEPNRKKGEEGTMIDKPVTYVDPMGEYAWDKISGVQWTDAAGVTHTIPKDELRLTPPKPETDAGEMLSQPAETQDAAPKPPEQDTQSAASAEQHPEAPTVQTPEAMEKQPPEEPEKLTPSMAREVLSTITEDSNTITIVGLRAYETRALDLADRTMQRLGTPRLRERAQASTNLWEKTKDAVKSVDHFVTNTLWKQSIGGIYFHERARQYYLDMLSAAETPFAESAIRLAEARATERYNKMLADSNFLVRIGTKAVDALKDRLGMRTAIQNMALEEISIMKSNGEIEGADVFEQEAKAIRARFSQDMDKADQFVRTQLGEKLEILDPEKSEHRPLVEGIQNLLKRYATGEIADRAEFDVRTKEFFTTTLKNVRPDVFAEAELYSSSLFDAAETLRTKLSHEAGLTNIDEAVAGMQIRLGLGAMGEVTSLEPTAVERGIGKVREVVEWLNKKHVVVPMVFNEATIGTGVAITLSAANFLKTVPARVVGGLGGGALAGGLFAGWREYGQLQKDYLTHMRQRESGAQFTEGQKRRAWFERFSVKQRSANEMMGTIQSALYENGQMKTDLTDDELRAVFATVADLQARKAVSEVGPKRIGMIQYSAREAIESERSALDVLANKALTDVEAYLTDHADQSEAVLGGASFPDFMVKLTTYQTSVLREGASVMDGFDDPVKATLGLVSGYAPEADIIKRRWPFAGRQLSETMGDRAEGVDAILDEFNKEARLEAVRYGVKAGVIGAAVGATMHGVSDLFAHRTPVADSLHTATQHVKDTIQDKTEPSAFLPGKDAVHMTGEINLSPPSADHVAHIAGHDYQLPKELSIIAHSGGPPDERVTTYDAVLHLKGAPVKDITLGSNIKADKLVDTLHQAGFTVDAGHAAIPDASKAIDIPGITSPYNDRLIAQIPPDYQLNHVGNAWDLLNAKHEVVAHGLKFQTDGALSNAEEVRTQLAAHGLTLDTSKTVELIGHDTIPAPQTEEAATKVAEKVYFPADHGAVISGEDMKNGGVWDYFLGRSHGPNSVSSANGMKNLFRLYEQQHLHDSVTFPEDSPHKTYIQEHLREAFHGNQKVQEMDLTRIPNDAQIGLPETVFGQHGIDTFNDLNNAAIKHLNDMVAAGHFMGADHIDHIIRGPGDAIKYLYENGNNEDKVHAIVLRLGYLGQDDKLPTDPKDLNLLLEKLGATIPHEAPASADATSGVVQETTHRFIAHNMIIKEIPAPEQPGMIFADKINIGYRLPSEIAAMAQAATEWPSEAVRAAARQGITMEQPPSELPWFPIFFPYHEALEPILSAKELTANAGAGETLFTPFYGGESAFLTKDAIESRRSPRLTEHPDATLNQKAEIDWYFSNLSEAESARLAELNGQIDRPFAPETRAIVTIPTLGPGVSVYDRLSRYLGQTTADGTPVDPKQTEFIVYDAQLSGQPESTVKADVERFMDEHPDIQVIYLSHAYDELAGIGPVKRDITNVALSRIATLPDGNPDAVIINDNGGNAIAPTYLAHATSAFDTEGVDLITGENQLPKDAYEQFPMLFAQHRAFELFDALVRHGESGGVPGVLSGNTAVRASVLAGVGGYNETSPFGEDRELAWVIRTARGGTSDTIRTSKDLAATIDPTETSYRMLQRVGLADAETPRGENDTYKEMSWTEMAGKANEAYTPEQLEEDVNELYHTVYPTLRATNPARFDAYFKRTMDALGVQYEMTEGTIKITNTESLAANMGADIDLETFAKDAAPAVVSETQPEPETSREALEQVAGEQKHPEDTASEITEPVASSVSSPDIETIQEEGKTPEQTASRVPEQELNAEAAKIESVEDRVNYILQKTKESTASVGVSTGELMDYLKTRLELAGGTRITGGKIRVEGNTVTLNDMVAKSPVGEAHFQGKLVTDPQKGLVVDMSSINYKLPMLMRLFEGRIKKQLGEFDKTLLLHMGQRTPKEWQATRIDIAGERIAVSFQKSTGKKA